MTHPTDALRLVPRRATPQQLETAAFNLSAEIGAPEAMKLGPHIELAYELLVAAAAASPLPEGGRDILWMMHVRGPDDIYPAPDYETAVTWCDYVNDVLAKAVPEVMTKAVPAIWTGTPESHADGLPESIKGWSLPAAPTGAK